MARCGYGPLYRFLRTIIRMVYPKYTVQVPQNISNPVVYISRHQNLFGPFITMLWFSRCIRLWVLHVFLKRETCYRQYVEYTFTKRYGWNKTLAQIVAFPLSYGVSALLNSAGGIPVYRGSRKILQTIQQSVAALKDGESVVIFPDIDYRDRSAHTVEMYSGFLYIEKYFYQATGQHVCFVPLYISKKQRLIIADQSIHFRDGEDFNHEKHIVYQKIKESLNQLAAKCGDV